MKVSPEEKSGDEDYAKKVSDAHEKKGKIGMLDKIHMLIDRLFTFTIMDIIEDDCRVRMLNVWAFLLVYVFFVLGVLRGAAPSSEITLGVKISTAAPRSLFAGRTVTSRHMTAYIVNVDGSPRQDASIEPHIVSFSPSGPLPCGYPLDAERLRNTLEGERLQSVCEMYVNGSGRTDEMGLSNITNYSLTGPTGIYDIGVHIPGEEFESEQFSTSITRTSVYSLEPLDPQSGDWLPAPIYATPGQPLAVQPHIRVRDVYGNPVPDVTVIAFANPDPTWPPKGWQALVPPVDREGQRSAKLLCPKSQPSDANGIARFTCLGLESSTSHLVNFIFSVDSFVFLPWNDPLYSFDSLSPIRPEPGVYCDSTIVRSPVRSVDVVMAPPSTVVEGDNFEVRVRALDQSGAPVQNVICKALIVSEYNNTLVMRFRRKLKGWVNKELLFASSSPSDSSGVAVFSELQISSRGNAQFMSILRPVPSSRLGIQFVCDGVASPKVHLTMQSTVAEVRIKRFITTSAFFSKYLHEPATDGSDTFVAVVRVLDANGRGVPGKSVFVSEVVDASGHFMLVAPVEKSIEATSEAGFAVVPFRVAAASTSTVLASQGSQQFRVIFMVDGVSSVESDLLTAKLREPLNTVQCHIFMPISISTLRPGGSNVWDPNDVNTVNPFNQRAVITAGELVHLQFYAGSASLDQRINFAHVPDRNGTAYARTRITSAYSTDGETVCENDWTSPNGGQTCRLQVEHEPILFEAQEIQDGYPRTPLEDLNMGTGGWAQALYKINAPSGTHALRMELDIHVPPYVDTCFCPPLMVEVRNPLDAIEVFDAAGFSEGGVYPVSQDLELDLTFYPNLDVQGVSWADTHLDSDPWVTGAVVPEFLEVPMVWQKVFLRASQERLRSVFNVTQVTPFTPNPTTMTGHMRVRFHWNIPGMFGDFALAFKSRGVHSSVYRFSISVPSDLTIEVQQEPGFQNAWLNSIIPCTWDLTGGCLPTLQPVPQQPKILVKSGGVPLNGVPIYAELVPVGSAVFEKPTALQNFDVTQMRHSELSGYSINEVPTLALVPGEEGIASFRSLGALDGDGCVQFRFSTGHHGVSLPGLYPATPLCFVPAWQFKISRNPPPSLPIGMSIDQLDSEDGGSEYIGITVRAPYYVPAMTSYSGLAAIRFAVTDFQGRELDIPAATATSKNLLTNTMCLFVNSVEVLDRCTRAEPVPGTTNEVSFRVKKLTWERVTEMPSSIKIMASDLSLSPLVQKFNAPPVPMPPGLPNMDAENKTMECLDAFMTSVEGNAAATTVAITPEVVPASASILLPPPDLVEVGETFLVRLRISTKSGSPARHGRIKVVIAGTSKMTPGAIDSDRLSELTDLGNTISSFRKPGEADLDNTTTEQEINEKGNVNFPITVKAAKSGNYVLKFQMAGPGTSVLFTTPQFMVMNPIGSIRQPEGRGWTEIEVQQFQTPERIAWQPQFEVIIPDGRSLHDLSASGIPVEVRAELRGSNKFLVQAKARMHEERQRAAQEAGSTAAAATTDALNAATRTLSNKASLAISRLTPEFQAQCMQSAMGALQVAGDVTDTRPASTAEAIMSDPSVLDPSALMGQFVRTATGGGSQMVTSSEMTAMLKVVVPIGDLALISSTVENGTFRGIYNITRHISFHFQEGSQYSWAFSLCGVQSAPNAFDTFTAVLQRPPLIQRVFDWIVTAVAGILCVIVLTTNTRKHHWCWHFVALVATIACLVIAPFLEGPVRALNGRWLIVAIVNLSLILICTVWAFAAEMRKFKAVAFATRKEEFQKQYALRQFCQFLSDTGTVVHPEQMGLFQQLKMMVKPFNADTCFFFPTQILVGFGLSLLSFGYLVIKTVEVALNIRKTIQALLNKVTQQGLGLMNSVDQVFLLATNGQELPDSAMQFVVTQLRMVTDWFQSLILGFEIGIWLGCVLAAIITLTVLLLTFWDFRRRVLNLRRGRWTFRKKDCLLYMDSNFMGAFIATTVVGYLTVVLAVTLVTLPIAWNVTREIIWSMRGFIWWTLLFPLILRQIQNQIFRRCLFGKTWVMHRPLLSIFMFWQTWLSFLGGIMSSLVRLIMALIGVVISLPQMMAACTPAFLNEAVNLDSTYKQYLACVVIYHLHNNPVANFAAKRMTELLRERQRRMKEDGVSAAKLNEEARRKTKRLLLLLLIKRPYLAKFRKSAIFEREARELAEKDKAAAQKTVIKNQRKPGTDEVKLLKAIQTKEVAVQEYLKLQQVTERGIMNLRDALTQVRQLPIGDPGAARIVEAALGHDSLSPRSACGEGPTA